MNRFEIYNDGILDPNLVFIDLDSGKQVEDITGFHLEVDQPNRKVILNLRKDNIIVKSNLDFATPNHAYSSQDRLPKNAYDI